MKKVLSLLMAIVVLVASLPIGNITAFAATSGTTGDCRWSLDGTVLTISGNGKMGNYYYSSAPWVEEITSVIIENGVTSIGNDAFYNCDNLTSATIGNSVTSIGSSAFSSCSSLTSITIPDSVTSIGEDAFWFCDSLTSITIGNSVTRIGEDAFRFCDSLTSITIPNSVTSIGNEAFRSCDSLKSITIGNSVTSIGDEAFSDCSNLSQIVVDENNTVYDSRDNCNAIIKTGTNTLIAGCKNTIIPNSVTSIGDRAFYYCDSLTSITIGDSVTSIGSSAFSRCSSLTNITIPDSVTSIGGSAFYYCGSLTSITIGDSVTSIGNGTFYYCDSLTSITIGDSVTSIGEDAFYFCDSLTSITIPNSVTKIGNEAFRSCSSLKSITIPNSVTSIDQGAFSDCDSLTDVWYLGSKEERNNIRIDSYNSELGGATWHYNACIGKAEHTFTDDCDTDCNVCGFIRTAPHDFEWVIDKQETCGKTGTKHEECTFCHIKRNENTVIPATGNHTYDNTCDNECNVCSHIRTIEHTYTNACDATCNICGFNRTPEPHKVNIYEVVNSTSYPFSLSNGVYSSINKADNSSSTFTINVQVTGNLNIEYYTSTESDYDKLTIAKNGAILVTESGETAWTTTNISVVSGDVITIKYTKDGSQSSGSDVIKFKLSSSLIIEDLEDIEPTCLGDILCSVCGFVIKEAADHQYSGDCDIDCNVCGFIREGNFGHIFSDAFDTKCDRCEYTRYIESAWVTVDGVRYEIYPSENGGIATINEFVNVMSGDVTILKTVTYQGDNYNVTSIGSNAFYDCDNLASITIPDSVTSIGSNAFYDCDNLTSITIPDSVTSIGDYAFYDCYSLENVYISDLKAWCEIETNNYDSCPMHYAENLYLNGEKIGNNLVIPEGTKRISNYAFNGCENIIMVTIPNSVTSIGNYAFSYCDSLINITIPGSVKTIGNYAFSGCNNLIKATLSDGVESIGSGVFYNCSSLVNITIPSSVTSIGSGAFGYCGSLTNLYINDIAAWCNIEYYDSGTSNPLYYADNLYINGELVSNVIIPEGITTIQSYAFSCNNIKSITIPSSVQNIYSDAFSGAHNLENIYIKDLSAWCNISFPTSIYEYDANPLYYAENLYLNNELVTDLVIPDGVETIKMHTFYGCNSIKTLKLPDSVTKIESYAFANCSNLQEVSLSKNLTILEENVFGDCYNIKKIFIPKNLMLIKKYNFEVDWNGTHVTDIYYEGTEEEWNLLADGYIVEGNEGLNNATIHYNSAALPAYIPGDIDGVEGITDRDAIHLLYHTFDPDGYPVNQECDFNGDGIVNDRDAIHLLYYTFAPETYPLH